MDGRMARPAILAAALLLASCSPTPPPGTEGGSPRYLADREACDDAASTAVNKRNAKTGLSWFASPVTRWSQIGDATDACMAEKGWGRIRACTADELRAGGRAGNLVVTAAGARCRDPGRNG